MPANLLNLSSYVVKALAENDHDYHIDAESKLPVTNCPHCQSNMLYKFGNREQMVRDLPMHGKRVGLYINTRRYRCQDCFKTFYEALPDIDDKRLMTKRLTAWMGKQAIKRTFAGIAEEVGCTESTARAVFSDYVNELQHLIRVKTPEWMGIDEIHLIKPRGVITNIQNNTVVEILVNRNKETMMNFLSNLKGKENIKLVSTDMWQPYQDACAAVIPQAKLVVDKFHVIKMANEAVEKVRKGLRDRLTFKEKRGLMHDRYVLLKREHDLTDKDSLLLSGWIKNYAELGMAYRLKEDFYKIYDCTSPDEAQGAYLDWKSRITPEVEFAFHDLTRAWDNWKPWILEYFNHPVTNAYTESLNNLIRVMNRLGRGYSFEALRAKILFAEGAQKKINAKPKFEKKDRPPTKSETIRSILAENEPQVAEMGVPEYSMMSRALYTPSLGKALPKPEVSPPDEISDTSYGADISTLIAMLENGEL